MWRAALVHVGPAANAMRFETKPLIERRLDIAQPLLPPKVTATNTNSSSFLRPPQRIDGIRGER
jgi:hypothetical protein